MAIGGWVQDLLLFEPFSNLRGSLAGCAQGEDLLYDGCGFFIDDPFLFVLWVFIKCSPDLPLLCHVARMADRAQVLLLKPQVLLLCLEIHDSQQKYP